MQSFIASILVKVLSDPKTQALLKKLLGELFNDVIVGKVLPLIPVAVAAAVKSAVDEAEKIPGVKAVVDIAKTTENAVSGLESLIPGLSDITDVLKSWGVNL